MASRRKWMMGSALGLAGITALAIGFTAWFWLPGEQAKLDRESTKLEIRVSSLARLATSRDDAPEDNTNQAVRALPASDTLPGWAGELLAEISATGASDMRYTLGQDNRQESISSRILETQFEADVTTLGNIFDRITLWRPGVSVTSLELESSEHGRIGVNLNLQLLGSDDV